jgi:hypothetical protein
MKTNQSPGECQKARDKQFSPKVHVLADTLVLVVSTNTWWFGGEEVLHKPHPHNLDTATTYPQVR